MLAGDLSLLDTPPLRLKQQLEVLAGLLQVNILHLWPLLGPLQCSKACSSSNTSSSTSSSSSSSLELTAVAAALTLRYAGRESSLGHAPATF